MAKKTYRIKMEALGVAHGRGVYRVKGPPRGWRISQGKKRKKAKRRLRSNLGKVYDLRKWAVYFAKGRPVRKVKGGWKICRKPRRKKKRKRR